MEFIYLFSCLMYFLYLFIVYTDCLFTRKLYSNWHHNQHIYDAYFKIGILSLRLRCRFIEISVMCLCDDQSVKYVALMVLMKLHIEHSCVTQYRFTHYLPISSRDFSHTSIGGWLKNNCSWKRMDDRIQTSQDVILEAPRGLKCLSGALRASQDLLLFTSWLWHILMKNGCSLFFFFFFFVYRCLTTGLTFSDEMVHD